MGSPKRIQGYPMKREMLNLLKLHGIPDRELRSINLIQEYEQGRVGYSFRGLQLESMKEFPETLNSNGWTVKFSKIDNGRGFIYLNKFEK